MHGEKILLKQMDEWYQTSPGMELLKSEATLLADILPRLFGYYLVRLGGPIHTDIFDPSPINKKILYGLEASNYDSDLQVQGDYYELPFIENSIDLMVLQHVLEFDSFPERILQAAYDALLPEGHLILLGFNPWSLFGLAKWISFKDQPPWRGHMLSAFRIKSWLTDMGFDVELHQSSFYRPPTRNRSRMRSLLFLENVGQLLWRNCGAFYVIVAKKRASTVTPIKPKILERRRRPVKGTFPEPTSRISDG